MSILVAQWCIDGGVEHVRAVRDSVLDSIIGYHVIYGAFHVVNWRLVSVERTLLYRLIHAI